MSKTLLRSLRGSLRFALAFALLAGLSAPQHLAAHELAHAPPNEVLDPTPPADRMVAATGDGLFIRSNTTPAISATRPGAFIKRSRQAGFDQVYRDKMIAATAIGRIKADDPVPAVVDTFRITLFDDVTVTLYKTGMHQDSLGSTIWTGRVVDAPGGEATLVFRNGQMGGSVRLGKQAFVIEPTAAGSTKITETDPDQRPHTNPLHAPTPSADQSSAPALSAPPAEPSGTPTVINVLVAYTPAAATAVADIQSAISMGISYTNQVLSNSGINTQINLVGVMQVNYSENGAGAATILNDAVSGAGGFSAVQSQRDALGADLVSVWSEFTDACGVAYQLDDADVNPTQLEAPYGYNAISLSFGYGCLTDGVAHEIGHNMGAGHDRYVDDPLDLLTARYNFGFVDVGDEIRTIMSYPNACYDVGLSCAIVPYHSSPNLTYQGHVLGIADTSPNAADNVRRINEIAPYIALFRSGGAATHTLSIAKIGTGTVSSSPSGISCGTTCSAPFVAGSSVTLTATPSGGSTFAGWSGGGCTGTGTCTVVMGADTTVTANFSSPPGTHTLTIVFAGSVIGQVMSNPPGSVFCTATCNLTITTGTTISLGVGLGGGVSFAGWSGACSGTAGCTVTLNSDVTITANFIPTPVTKTLYAGVSFTSTGTGTITASPTGMSACNGCAQTYVAGTTITLTATPDNGSVFTGWSGGSCSGTGSCTVTLYTDTGVYATFRSLNQKTLTVALIGPGSVQESAFGRINCGLYGNICSAFYAPGASVPLVAEAEPGVSIFTGWTGAPCIETDQNGSAYFCEVSLASDATITANFRLLSSYDVLSVSSTGGIGTVQLSPAYYCSQLPCNALEEPGSQITLTASPAFGYNFTGWSGGGCSGTSTCTVTMNGAVAVTATFGFNPTQSFLLSVSKTGTGAGTLTTSPDGQINCGSTCSARFVDSTFPGSFISLNATPATGSVFNGWNGFNCPQGNNYSFCNINSSTDIALSASFSFIGIETLSVAKTGNGGGVITGPAAISCGSTCSADLTVGAQVVLFAGASQGSIFTGWSGGGCSGTFACSLTLNANTAVTANFIDATKTSLLSIVKTGTGGGTVAIGGNVTSGPLGISCGGTCTASFAQGLPITLTATPQTGSTFTGWSGGGCSGNQTCTLALSADTQVTANFMVNSKTSITLAAAILPSSRSVEIGSSATLFGTVINAGPGMATYCGVVPTLSIPTAFTFQTTSSATNAPTGTPNTPVNIPAGAAQSFVLAFTPTIPFGPTDVPFTFSCTNADAAASYTGVNTLQLSASSTPVPDVVAIAGTTTNDGTLHIPGPSAAGAFAVAVANVGSAGTITAGADTGSANLPLSLTICQTDQASGACLSPPAPVATTTVNNNATASFGIFVTATAQVPFMPAVNRIFVRFYDSNHTVRGSTSVAVRTE